MEKIKKLTTKEIVEYVELTNILCNRYQKTLTDYNGLITSPYDPYLRKAKESYDKCINIYNMLLEEAEDRIIKLKEEEKVEPTLLIEEEKVKVETPQENNKEDKEVKVKNVKSKKTKK